MPIRQRAIIPVALALATALAACAGGPAAVKPQGGEARTTQGKAGLAGQASPAAAVKVAISGVVTAPAGVVSNNGGGILSNNGGSLISDKAGGLLSDAGGQLVSKLRYGLLAAGPQGYGLHALEQRPLADATVILATAGGKAVDGVAPVKTDAAGRYTIEAPARGGPYRVVVPIVTAEGKLAALATLVGTAVSASTKLVAADVDYGSTLVTAKVVSDPAKAPTSIDNAAMRQASAAMTADAATGPLVDLADRGALEAKASEVVAATPVLQETFVQVVAPQPEPTEAPADAAAADPTAPPPSVAPTAPSPTAPPASAAPSEGPPASPSPDAVASADAGGQLGASPTPSAAGTPLPAGYAEFEVGGTPDGIAAVNGDLSVWVVDQRGGAVIATHLGSEGQKLGEFTSPVLPDAGPGDVAAIAVDGTKQAWVTHRAAGKGRVYRLTANGTLAQTITLDGKAPGGVASSTVDQAVWVVGAAWLGKFDYAGVAGPEGTFPGQVGTDAVGGDDHAWFIDRTGPSVVRADAAGTRVVDYGHDAARLYPDGNGGVWVSGDGLERLEPTNGDVVATHLAGETTGALAVRSDGSLWVGVGGEMRHLSAAGAFIKAYPLATPPSSAVFSIGTVANRRLWVTHTSGTKITRITP